MKGAAKIENTAVPVASAAPVQMEYRHLGRTGLKVSVLSYGAWVSFGNQVTGVYCGTAAAGRTLYGRHIASHICLWVL